MNNIKRFPIEGGGSNDPGKGYVSLGFAGLAVALSVLTATLTGGVMMGQATARIDNVMNFVERDHRETKSAIDALTANINSVGIQASSLATQVENLKQALQSERADRLESERRYYIRDHPK